MPYAENAYLHRASAVLVLLASNTMFVPDPASPRGRTILALCTTRLIGVMVAVIVMEMSGKCLRQTVFEDQDAFNLLAVTTILTNIKASLVIVFLLADAVGSLANSRTWLDVTKSYEVLQQLEGDDSPYVTSEQKMAEQVFEETVRGFQAVFAGGTLNLTLFISFVLSSIARLSILDVAELKVTFVEGLVGVASLTLIFLTLISLGFLQAHQGADLATLNAFFTSMWLSGFVSVVGCGIIARSISKGCHPYFEQRSERERGEGGPLLLVGG
ncbi:expressed unknown protein [Seminavis robusta]|uniref:Transmembrane protein n=1 Tax=Seminavis robusta TaxID=568900 RepID=A0A9N8F4P5_9STRA|nr:expressed unknown protein [Seminavis robusta]|eukprot:Sro2949_g340870.1 n/a (271) ;mRNA; f:2569-3381